VPADSQTQLYVSGQPPAALPRPEGSRGGERWWETEYGRWRRDAEREAMARHFPSFNLCEALDGSLSWLGWLTSSFDPERRYAVQVTYPDHFPDLAPGVTIASPKLPDGVPHVLGPQRPCLFQPSQGPRNGYDPGRTTAATLVAWTALWIHAFETWQATGRWPGRAD
jgi:hypothetical protein